VILACLLALAASARGQAGLGEPLWTGDVSLNGFTLGTDSIYLAAPGGNVVISRELATGRQRWSLDITDLPDTTTDLGGGVVSVATRKLSNSDATSFSGRPDETIRFVRASTGQQIGQTVGHLDNPSAAGLPAIVFRDRPPGSSPGCEDFATPCVDVAAWRMSATAAEPAWRLSLPPGANIVPGIADGKLTGLLELDDDGTMRLRDLASGAVQGTASLSQRDRRQGQPLLARDAVVIGRRQIADYVLTAYRRPSLTPMWSVHVPAPKEDDTVPFSGMLYLTDCGSVLCVHLDGGTSQLVDLATGSATPRVDAEVHFRLGDGPFIAGTATFGPNPRPGGILLVNQANRVISAFPDDSLIDWADSGGRALIRQTGRDRTGFIVVDDRGRTRSIGSVTGTNLTCGARGDILACGNGRGTLRVWRLP
jgi:hypothetical protein